MAWNIQFPVLHLNAILDHSEDKAFLEDSSWYEEMVYFLWVGFTQLVSISGAFSW